jgi:hypothetical protein
MEEQPHPIENKRDLALVEAKMGNYDRCLQLLSQVVLDPRRPSNTRKDADDDESFGDLKVTALIEYVNIRKKAQRQGIEVKEYLPQIAVEERIDVDLRVTAAWSAQDGNIGLLVIDPGGEVAYYDNMRTRSGGLAMPIYYSSYGPDTYQIKRADPGRYLIKCVKHGKSWRPISGPSYVKVSIYENYGRPDEGLTETLIRLPVEDYQVVDAAEVRWQ